MPAIGCFYVLGGENTIFDLKDQFSETYTKAVSYLLVGICLLILIKTLVGLQGITSGPSPLTPNMP